MEQREEKYDDNKRYTNLQRKQEALVKATD